MNLTLTDTAYTHIGNLLKQHDKKYVRLQVKGGGCAGFEYEWSFENEAEKDDHVIDDRLLVHKMNELYLLGVEIDYDSEIYEIEKQIMFSENKITEQNEMCESLNGELMSLQLDKKDLETKIDSIPAEVIDICEVLKDRNKQEQDISTYNSNVDNCNVILAEKNELLDKIAKFEESFDIVSVKNQKDEIDEKLLKISNLLTELENAEKLKELNEKKVALLGEVPCGDKFKSCKFIKDAHCSKEALVDLVGQVQSINNEKEKAERLLNKSNEEKINSHLENYQKLMEKRREAERVVLKTDLEKGKWQNSILSALSLIPIEVSSAIVILAPIVKSPLFKLMAPLTFNEPVILWMSSLLLPKIVEPEVNKIEALSNSVCIS